ncbi:ANTAR domain-containing protein [Micromonospora siamensis]|uniref:ANTAR domain-containing protein n=1 Tax=Micromonospora siamensis TaxID=299152 RepID=A0A1C5I6T9_9ACTN|nr:ANTAR domain-containing protein [Micromonospora siamensis]SCG53885.1 ANTAR domain-containing protein [Micromonospora siamensis]
MTRRRRATPAAAPPASTVARLRRELDGLRRAQRSQAVVEQATGLLIARLGCSPEDAFAQLARMSQQTNTRLVEVAAALLGVAAPPSAPTTGAEPFRPDRYLHRPPSPAPDRAPARVPLAGQVAARYHLARAAMTAAADPNALAEALWTEGVRHLAATSTLLGVLEPDGAVRLAGSYGLPPSVASRWQRAPASVNMAFLRTAVDGRPLWLTRDEAHRLGYDFIGGGAVRACLPLRRSDRTFGVAAISWDEHREFDAATRAYVEAVTEVAGRRLAELSPGAPAAHWVETVLDALPGSVAWWCPVRDPAGEIVDWRFDRCGPEATDGAGRPAGALTGRHLLDVHPSAAEDGIVAGCAAALRDGVPFRWGPGPVWQAADPRPVPVLFSLRAVPFGDGLLASWAYHDEQRRTVERVARLERAGDVGWTEWDFAAGRVEWSPAAYPILARDVADGPLPLGALHRCAAEADAPALRAAVHALTERAEPVDMVFTLRRHGETRPVRFLADPVVDGAGRVTGVRGAVARA